MFEVKENNLYVMKSAYLTEYGNKISACGEFAQFFQSILIREVLANRQP